MTGELRLDPFALPSATTSRFLLLILSVVAASIIVYRALGLLVTALALRCFGPTLADCPQLNVPVGIFMAAALLALMALALLGAAAYPAYRTWRDRLAPVKQGERRAAA